jgi:hypothetical protein
MATCYTLQSCDNLSYPDIENICWDGTHPMEGLIVYINQVYNGNAINTGQTYTLVLVGVDLCVCEEWLPFLATSTIQTCVPTYDIFKYANCESGTARNFGFPSGSPSGAVIRKDGDCECWSFVGEESVADELITAYTEYDDCTECLDTRSLELCSFGERSISYAVMVTLPPPIPPDKGFDECCYTSLVLADLSDISKYKNDYSGTYFKRQIPNSSVVFKLIDANLTEYPLVDSTYGIFSDFGGVQPDLSYFIVEWRKVLSLLGEGTYKIKQEVDIAGITIPYFSNTFTLKAYSIAVADKTARIDCTMDGLLVDENVNFKGSGFKTTLRVRGFFGNNKPEFEQDNVTRRDYYTEQVSFSQSNKYIFQGQLLPECVTTDFYWMLKGNDIFCSDYNINNHSYKYEVLPVIVDNSDGEAYFPTSRDINLNFTFRDRYNNNRKLNC